MRYADGSEMVLSTDEIMEYMSDISVAPYVVYNNKILAFEEPPVIENGTTLIPIRFLFEQMGAEVDWDSDTQTASISDDDTVISFSIDNTTAKVNGKSAEMTVSAQLINDKTMVPVRFLSEELGYTVTWDGDNRIITIE
ncbi:MAG: copper amine oxidase N-terminal domain-containing protein [Ruminococcus sp.]|nr:copper amine oxidase N-terminal domain-containing protein [Ruminococcus sp.]